MVAAVAHVVTTAPQHGALVASAVAAQAAVGWESPILVVVAVVVVTWVIHGQTVEAHQAITEAPVAVVLL
jgi:hypothetical protein